jgi:hypothetical protein
MSPRFHRSRTHCLSTRAENRSTGYTTLQDLISEALSVERNRLGKLLNELLDESDKLALLQLLVHEDTLSGLAALKEDAKHFGYHMMVMELQKRAALEPVYQ